MTGVHRHSHMPESIHVRCLRVLCVMELRRQGFIQLQGHAVDVAREIGLGAKLSVL